MELRGLFEQRITTFDSSESFQTLYFRSVVIDIDTIRDAAATAARGIASIPNVDRTKTTYTTVALRPHQDSSTIEAGGLDALGSTDRNRLLVQVEGINNNGIAIETMHISTYLGQRPYIYTHSQQMTRDLPGLARTVATVFIDGGTPRIDIFRLRRIASYLPLLAYLAALIWVTITIPLQPAALTLLWLTLPFAAGATIALTRWLAKRDKDKSVGCRTIMQNRAETANNRANHKRDTRVAAITFVSTVIAGLIGLWLAGILHLNPDKTPTSTPTTTQQP